MKKQGTSTKKAAKAAIVSVKEVASGTAFKTKTQEDYGIKEILFDDRVLILPDVTEEKTKGGIIVPEEAKKPSVTGTVVAIGATPRYALKSSGNSGYGSGDAEAVELTKDQLVVRNVKVGDRVQYSQYSGTDAEIRGTVYKVMRASDLLMKNVD